MAAPANSFRRVDGPDRSAITVIIRQAEGQVTGEVLGPGSAGDASALRMGEGGSLTAHQALSVACHLANGSGDEVVVVDPGGHWKGEWGRLDAA